MFPTDAFSAIFTRLGEAQILLPAMAAGLLWLVRTPRTRPLALAWLAATAAAALLTTASKVAFIGWGLGYAAWDYTGISGHAMFAAVVLPVLARIAAGRAPRPWPRLAIGAAYLLAAGIAASRVDVGAHSVSEVIFGFVIGASASALALRGTQAPQTPTPGWVAAGLLAWMLVLPLGAPPSRTHDWVTALSLRVSGRPVPYTRGAMHRQAATIVWYRFDPARGGAGASSGTGHPRRAPAAELQFQPVTERQLRSDAVR